MNTFGGVDVQIHVFLTPALVASCQCDALAVLLPVPIEHRAGWAQEPFWTSWRSVNS
jgi:hypothetical protein